MPPPRKLGEPNSDAPQITALIRAPLEEDLGAGDLTTSALVAQSARAKARIVAKQEQVLAGLPLAERVFRALDAGARFEASFGDGARVHPGAIVEQIEGAACAPALRDRSLRRRDAGECARLR